MFRFMAGGRWLVAVPNLQVAECLGTGLLNFASRRGLIASPGGDKVEDYLNGVPEFPRIEAFSGLHERYYFGLTISKDPSAIALRLIASPVFLVIRSNFGQA